MTYQRVLGRRLLFLLLGIAIWTATMSALFSWAAEGLADAAITGVLAVAALIAALNRRIIGRVEGRPLATSNLVIFAMIAAGIVLFEIWNIRIKDILIEDEVHLPSLILTLRALGNILLSIALLLESVRMLLARPRSERS